MVLKPVTQGFKFVGRMKGYVEQPWRNDANKVNRRIAIAEEYTDQFGDLQSNVVYMDVPYSEYQIFKDAADNLKGKMVEVPVRPSAKPGGRNGAWISYFIVPGSQILEVKPG